MSDTSTARAIADAIIRVCTPSDDPVTPESVARARADAQRQRDEIARQTGVVIREDGTIQLLRSRKD